jgi:hypothetical protein
MVRPRGGAAGLISGLVAATIICSLIAIVTVAVLADQFVSPWTTEENSPARQANSIVRDSKTDALPMPRNTHERAEIKSVEVVGIRDAAIIYRDRAGNVLFRTDPVANVTIVAKNVDLPEVTIRDTAETTVQRMVVEGGDASLPPQGCESSFARPSPVALTRISSRCLAQATAASKLAALQ